MISLGFFRWGRNCRGQLIPSGCGSAQATTDAAVRRVALAAERAGSTLLATMDGVAS